MLLIFGIKLQKNGAGKFHAPKYFEIELLKS